VVRLNLDSNLSMRLAHTTLGTSKAKTPDNFLQFQCYLSRTVS